MKPQITATFTRIIKKTARWVYRSVEYRLACFPLGEGPLPETESRRFTCRRLERSDLPAVESTFGPAVHQRFVRRMEARATGYLLAEGPRLRGYVWCTSHPLRKEGVAPFTFDVVPRRGCIYWFDGRVLREARNQGGLTLLLNRLKTESAAAGFTTAFWLFDTRNAPVRRVAEKLGFAFVGGIRYRRFLFLATRELSALDRVCESNTSANRTASTGSVRTGNGC